MALSVRLPIDFSPDIDHYLIETSVAGVRLEGSPNFFRYLPQLLQYYCEHGLVPVYLLCTGSQCFQKRLCNFQGRAAC